MSALAPSSAPRVATRRLTILVADDYELARWGLRLVLRRAAWVDHVIEAADPCATLKLARTHEPDVAVVAARLGDLLGKELEVGIRAASPGTRVLVVEHSWSVTDVIAAVHRAGFEAAVPAVPTIPDGPLNARERQVLEHIAQGETNREIGAHLHLSPDTVKDHTRAVYRKLAVRNRAQAVRRGHHLGLLV